MNANLTSIGGYGYPISIDLSMRGAFWYFGNEFPKYDLKQYRYKLPMP